MSVLKRWNGTSWETIGPAIMNSASTIPNDSNTNGPYISNALDNLNENKLTLPSPNNYGEQNQYLRSTGTGIEWVDFGLPSDEQTSQAIEEWLNNHPESTTTVQDNSLTKEKFTEELSLLTIKDYVTPEMFGAKCDGVYDDSIAINNAILYCKSNNIKTIKLLANTYTIKNPILINTIVKIEGMANTNWNNLQGTILKPSNNITCINVQNPMVELSNFKIIGNNTNIGISYGVKTENLDIGIFSIQTSNVCIAKCDIGFDIQNAWTYIFNLCRIENTRIGFNINQGTSGTFNSCVAFNCSEYGFYCTKLNYGTFNGCGCDGCKYGFYFSGACRGVSLNACGAENTQDEGYMVYGGDRTYLTIIAFSVGLYDSTSNKNYRIFVFEENCRATLIDCNVGTNYHSPGYTLDASGPNITLINCYLSGDSNGLEKVNSFGYEGLKTTKKLEVENLFSYVKRTPFLGKNQTQEIKQLSLSSFYIFAAVATGNAIQKGFGFICIPGYYESASIMNFSDADLVQGIIDSNGMFSIINKSSTSRSYDVILLRLGQ